MRYPWELSKQAADAKCDENVGFDADALFVDVTFDFLVAPHSANHEHCHTPDDTKNDISVAIRIGSFAAIPSTTGVDYHYIQQHTLTREHVHNHCREVNVDPIHTDAGMVADILATSFLSNTSWQVARKVCEKSVVKTSADPMQEEQLWQLKLNHKGQLEGETGFLPLAFGWHNDCLGGKVDERMLHMILLQSNNGGGNCMSIPDEEGCLFWGYANKAVLQEIDTIHHAGDGIAMETAPIETNPASNPETKVSALLPMKQDSKTEPRSRPAKSSRPVETTMYAPAKKTYIAGSKKKKPKFTLGSL